MSNPSAESALRDHYRQEFDRVRLGFEATGLGQAALRERTELVDRVVLQLWEQHFAALGTGGSALVALGGFGRKALFPYSDVDLLFLCESELVRGGIGDSVRSLCQGMWDIGLRVSPTTRTLEDCSRFDQDNIEFTIALLDCRFLAGDAALFSRLRDRNLPQLVGRESHVLAQRLAEVTRTRHLKYANTIFHLEPNLKDGPGGLRDAHVAHWLTLIGALGARRKRSEPFDPAPAGDSGAIPEAMGFLCAARCYLHYRAGRDENNVTWETQDELAMKRIGAQDGLLSSAEWMRLYFRHAKALYRNTTQLLAHVPNGRSALYQSFQRWRSRISNEEFSVVDGRIFLQQAAGARDPHRVLRLLTLMARHGVGLSIDAERRINNAYRGLAAAMPQDSRLWQHLRELLVAPHAAEALRAMHSLKLVTLAIPEFEAIDSLVLRDLYHRYTVDEHSFLAIEILHGLKNTKLEWLAPYAQLFSELERPDLLLLALLLHDVGKGLAGTDHVHNSLQLAAAAIERMELPEHDAATVGFLIASHLEMSSTLRRRDIFDPDTIRELAHKVGTPERLKMLTLLTLADIRAVNPDALTPWKAENLWSLYIGTASYFTRSVDEERFHAKVCTEQVERIARLLPKRRSPLLKFLDGLPQRYLLSHPPEQVIVHFEMSSHLKSEPVQLALRRISDQHELTIVTADRPGLFATLTGILYAWGMDIAKASAFSNGVGVIVDSFYFRDRFRTIELNPPERDRFKKSVGQILMGEASLDQLLESRLKADLKPPKVKVDTRLRFDDASSPGSTLLEVVTQDRPGLLHTISATLAGEKCSIEVALIDTEGAVAHDVFYLTSEGEKLSHERQRAIEWALSAELAEQLPANW